MTYRRLKFFLFVGLVTLLVRPVSAPAVSCPSGGAELEVCVLNPTSEPTVQVVVSGSAIQGETTCTSSGLVSTYQRTLNVSNSPDPPVRCTTISGLLTGNYVHSVAATIPATGQRQYTKGPILFSTNPLKRAEVHWTVFKNVLTVNTHVDPSSTGCLENCVSGCPTCSLRQSINKANDIAGDFSGNNVLIQFAPSVTQEIELLGSVSLEPCMQSLCFTRRGFITIDGTDASGNPWTVGDPNAITDPFPRVVDLNNAVHFDITESDNVIRGLHVKNSVAANAVQQNNLFFLQTADAKNNLIERVKIDGGNSFDCFNQNSGSPPGTGEPNCIISRDLVNVNTGGTSFGEPGVTVRHVELTFTHKSWLDTAARA